MPINAKLSIVYLCLKIDHVFVELKKLM